MDFPRGYDDDPPPRRERPAGGLEGATFSQTVAAERILREAAKLDRRRRGVKKFATWKEKRDLVICLGHCFGLSNRFLGEAFQISSSGVWKIVTESLKPQPPTT